MITVTVVAGWGTDVVLLQKGNAVDAFRVLFQLIRADSVSAHVHRVGMARTARCGKVDRIDLGPDILRCQDVVASVAACALRHLRVTPLIQFSMDAAAILLILIDGHRWVIRRHVAGIGMASCARCRNVRRVDGRFSVRSGENSVRSVAGGALGDTAPA